MFEDDDDEMEDYHKLPIFKKGREILELTEKVISLIPEKDEFNEYRQWMMQDAMTLSVKVTGAEAGGMYDIKMECAAFIRKAARDLQVNCTGLKIMGFKETDYLDVIRNEIEEYRLLFIDWINSFDPWDYAVDRWGLFNPPGVGPFDEDADDKLPPPDLF